MADLRKYRVIIATCAVILAITETQASVEEFEQIKNEVFGLKGERFVVESLSKKIYKMMKLLSSESIPAKIQGQVTFVYLSTLSTFCAAKKSCNLEEDLARLDLLMKRTTSSSEFHTYLKTCTYHILKGCALEVHESASKKLRPLNEQTFDVLKKLAVQVQEDASSLREELGESELGYSKIVLKVLREMDPVKSKKIMNKWTRTGTEKSMKKFMDKIRLPCVAFLQNLDPSVELYPAQTYNFEIEEPMGELMIWSFYKKTCSLIVERWVDIMRKAKRDYAEYLGDPK